MNRREFIQALASAGVVAAVGINLAPQWDYQQIRSALTFEESYSIEWDCYVHRAVIRNSKGVFCSTAMGGMHPATEDERVMFLDESARALEALLNRGDWRE